MVGISGAGGSTSGSSRYRYYREILIFLPNEGDVSTPIATAQALTDALGVGYADLGFDGLTGSVELRLHYDPALYDATWAYLQSAGVVFEMDKR